MLNTSPAKSYFLGCFLTLCSLQIFLAITSELFVDEAFYWLEGQYLAWSYSEVPGWVPWMSALTDWVFPKHPFWLRLPSLIAVSSIPWLGMFLSKLISKKNHYNWGTGLLLLSLPIMGLSGTLAVADIWIIYFTLLAFIAWIVAIKSKQISHYLLFGLILAIGINVHIRFWLIVLITCLVVFWQFKNDRTAVFSLLKFTLPMMLIGFIPILLFNLQNDFPLLAFQLKDRHPWEFQPNHFSFFVTQILITTPLVFYLCFKTFSNRTNLNGKHDQISNVLVFAAIIHWLLYALLGFYSDTLRLNLHWTLVSYVLLLIATSLQINHSNKTLLKWSIVTGVSTHMLLLCTIIYWQNWQQPKSNLNAQITFNAMGWKQLAKHTEQLLKKNKQTSIVADNFMTLAQLHYYSDEIDSIRSIPHPLSHKHGRTKQLQIMNLELQKTTTSRTLVVEHSALNLQQQILFYRQTCQHLNGIELIDSLDLFQGLKTYYFFKTGGGACQVPPIIYHERNGNTISGWIIENKTRNIGIELLNADKHKITMSRSDINHNELFNSLHPGEYQLLNFSFDQTIDSYQSPVQLKVSYNDQTILSHRFN